LKEKIGIDPRMGDYGKWLCGVRMYLQRKGCVVYSFGSDGDTTFEQDILQRTKCSVHIFDPSLSESDQQKVLSVPGIVLHTYGLGAFDGRVRKRPLECLHLLLVLDY
jgi:hypothetical protein